MKNLGTKNTLAGRTLPFARLDFDTPQTDDEVCKADEWYSYDLGLRILAVLDGLDSISDLPAHAVEARKTLSLYALTLYALTLYARRFGCS